MSTEAKDLFVYAPLVKDATTGWNLLVADLTVQFVPGDLDILPY